MTLPSEPLYQQRKRCAKCKEEKSLNEFFRNLKGAFGRKSRCKKCTYEEDTKRAEKYSAERAKSNLPNVKICSCPPCVHLGIPQPVSNFCKDVHKRDGLKPRCNDCERRFKVRHPSKNPLRQREADKQAQRRYYEATRELRWHIRSVGKLKNKSQKEGIPFNMKAEDLFDNTGALPVFCPIFPHIKLDYNGGKDRRCWASVDRIVPELGYISGNVWIVSFSGNFWKNNGSSPEERERIVAIMNGRKKKKEPDAQQPSLFDDL